jgi:hypothetical protein
MMAKFAKPKLREFARVDQGAQRRIHHRKKADPSHLLRMTLQ